MKNSRVLLFFVLLALVIGACSPKESPVAPTLALTSTTVPPTNTPTVTPTATQTPTLVPTSTSTATLVPTATEIPIDPVTKAFVEAHGSKFADYVWYDAEEKVYKAHLVFTGEFVTDVMPITNSQDKVIGDVKVSMKMEYYNGKSLQSVLVALMVDIKNGNCLHLGANGYYLPCARLTPAQVIDVYEKGFVGLEKGWKNGDVIEVWFTGDEAPKRNNVNDSFNRLYIQAHQTDYDSFIKLGNPAIKVVVPNRLLLTCSTDTRIDPDAPCYPSTK